MILLRFLRRVLAGAALTLAIPACSGSTATGPADTPSLVITGSGPETTRMDPAEIVQAQLRGDLLHLEVRHGGGCARHDFSLLHSGVFLESLPVQTYLTLAHDAHGDPCRALLTKQLRFDLTPLRRAYQKSYGQGGVLVLHLRAPGSTGAPAATVQYEF